MKGWTIKKNLIVLIMVMLGGSVAIAAAGLSGMRGALDGLNSVYLNRVVPLRDLRKIADLYAVSLAEVTHKAHAGDMAPAEAVRQIEAAETSIRQTWEVYWDARLVDEEKRLVARIVPLMEQIDESLLRLKVAFSTGDNAAVEAFSNELYQRINPLAAEFEKLVEVQLYESERQYQNGLALYERDFALIVGLLAMLLLGGGMQAWLISRGISQRLGDLRAVAAQNAAGDLSQPVLCSGADEITAVQVAFRQMQENLRDTIHGIQDASTQLTSAAEQLNSVTDESASGIAQQNDEIQMAATAVTEMSAAVDEVARNAELTSSSSRQAELGAEAGRHQVSATCSAIEQLGERLQVTSVTVSRLADEAAGIGQVVDVIHAIAKQTNLLALNAAIEAARAGDQGRGFAVVAEEVRALAQRTQGSTQEIERMIGSIQRASQESVVTMAHSSELATRSNEMAKQADGALELIAERVGRINEMNLVIASAAVQQAQVAREVDRNLVAISDIAIQNSTGAYETSRASNQLASLASRLNDMAQRFVLAH